MAVFEIRDAAEKTADEDFLTGFLFYYEKSRRFYVELLSENDEWSAPFIFAGGVSKGIFSFGPPLADSFVRQRIIPRDRQNLGSILKVNNLREYDEYRLLLLSEGRCSQDDLYLKKTDAELLPEEILQRLGRKVKDVIPMEGHKLTVFFNDKTVRLCHLDELVKGRREFDKILSDSEIFMAVKLSPGGNGIEWGTERIISAEELRENGAPAEISYESLLSFVKYRLADTTETAAIIDCSRQYIGQLVREERLHSVREGSNNNLFLKSEIEVSFI